MPDNKDIGDLYPKTTYSVDEILNEIKLKSGGVSAKASSEATPPAPKKVYTAPEIIQPPIAKVPEPPAKIEYTTPTPAQSADKIKSFFNKSKEQAYTPDKEAAKTKIDKLLEPEPVQQAKVQEFEAVTHKKGFGISGLGKRAPHALTAEEVLGVKSTPEPVKPQNAIQPQPSAPFQSGENSDMRTTEFDVGILRLKKNVPEPVTAREIKLPDVLSDGDVISSRSESFQEDAEPNRVKTAINGFVLSGDEEENAPDEMLPTPEAEELNEIDDYSTVEDAPSIRMDLEIRKRGLLARITFTSISALILLFFALVPILNISLPKLISPTENPLTYLLINATFALFALIVNARSVFGGFFSLFRFRGDLDTAVGTAMIASIAHTIYMCWNTSQIKDGSLFIYPAVAVVALLFNNIGKLCMISRIKRNFELVGNANIKKTVFSIYDEEASDMAKGVVLGEPVVCVDKSVVNLKNFLNNSFCEDPADNMCQTLAPIGFIASLLSAVLIGFITNSIPTAVTIFTAVLCICVPTTSLLASNLPLYRASKRLFEMETMLSGYNAVEEFSDTNLIAIDAEELFPPGFVDLLSIKTSGIISIDEAILDAAAVAIYAGGPLSDVFDKVIEGRRKMLPKVDSLLYEDDKGITGVVSGRNVRIGNRRLMEAHSIFGLPDIEYEKRIVRDGGSPVYLASDGNLAAMFVVKYNVDDDVAHELDKLINRGVTILIKTSDANITAEKVSKLFYLPLEGIKIMPANSVNAYEKLTVPSENGEGLLSHNNNLTGFAAAISACIRLRGNIMFATVLQTIGVILGFGFALVLAISSQYKFLSADIIVAYQLFFAILVILLPSLRRP